MSLLPWNVRGFAPSFGREEWQEQKEIECVRCCDENKLIRCGRDVVGIQHKQDFATVNVCFRRKIHTCTTGGGIMLLSRLSLLVPAHKEATLHLHALYDCGICLDFIVECEFRSNYEHVCFWTDCIT